MPDSRIALLLFNLDCAFDKGSFHGTTLKGSLRGLTPEVARWRPSPDRHNIWEYLLHAAYWKYAVRRHLIDGPKFERKPSNWPKPTELRADIRYLAEEHVRLRTGVEAFPASRLTKRPTKRGPTYVQLILGVAAHDLHHTGQIQLLKRLQRSG